MRRTNKSDYIILALICLIVLNLGSVLISHYVSGRQEMEFYKSDLKLTFIQFDSLKGIISKEKLLRKTINSLYPIAEILYYEEDNLDNETITASYEELDEEEHNSSKDILIENLEEYDSLIIVRDNDGVHKVENVPEPLMLSNLVLDRSKAYVLMYHTHATESYALSKAEDYRTSVRDYNMVGMGDIIATVLEANNHKVDHVETYHDLPSYNQSYSRSLNTIRKKQEESQNLKVLLDVHRNAVKDDHPQIDKIRAKSKTEINGKSVATFSLVIGPDSENYDKVLSFAKYIKAVSDAIYPGLCTEIIIKPIGRYNQYLSDYSALIELGYHLNTIDEAKEGAKLLGEILSIVLDSIMEE